MSPASVCVLALLPGLLIALDRIEASLGAARAGWISSFPIVGAPAMLIIAIEHGSEFGSQAAKSAALGVGGWAAFVCCYRFLRIEVVGAVRAPLVVPVSVLAWLGIGLALSSVDSAEWLAVGFVLGGVSCLAVLFGSASSVRAERSLSVLLARVGMAALMVALTIGASYTLGPRAAGFLTTFPIVSSSLIVPIAFRREQARVRAISSGMLTAGPALGTFMAVFSLLLGLTGGLTSSFALSIVTASGVHFGMWSLANRGRTASPC